MDRERTKRIYDLHAWSGVICGLFVFIVSFSGILALFGEEIAAWEDRSAYGHSLGDAQYPVAGIMEQFLAEAKTQGELLSTSMLFPTAVHPFYRGLGRLRSESGDDSKTFSRRWHVGTGEVLPAPSRALSDWLVKFHAHLMLPRTPGRAVVGLAGVLLLLSIVTGIITHRKLFQEMFTWRLDRSVRLKWQDTHKIIGVWGLPFHLAISVTGCFLGFYAVLLPVIALLSFQGDQDAAYVALVPQGPPPSGISAEMIPLDQAYLIAERRTGIAPTSVNTIHWGDRDGVYRFFYPPANKLILGIQIDVSAVTGDVVAQRLTDRGTPANRALTAMMPLHYGTFGGYWLKGGYTLLGIGLCVVVASGLMMWLERRRYGNVGRRSDRFYAFLGRLNAGVCTGLCLASVGVFYVGAVTTPDLAVTGWSFFALWGLTVVWGLWRPNPYRTTREILGLSSLCLTGLPVLVLVQGQELGLSLLIDGQFHPGAVDIAGFSAGLAGLIVVLFLPDQRPADKRAGQR